MKILAGVIHVSTDIMYKRKLATLKYEIAITLLCPKQGACES